MPTSALHHRVRAERAVIRLANDAAVSATVSRSLGADELAELGEHARYLEVRGDLAGDLDPRDLREHFGGSLVYSLPSAEAGGRAETSARERRTRLVSAARGYDLIDLEHGRDTYPEVLAGIPAERRRISWRGPAADLGELRQRFERMSEVPARLYLLVPEAASAEDGLAVLRLLESLARRDVTAFATGAAGTWTRLLAPRLGARIAYGLHDDGEAVGELTVRRIRDWYGFPVMPRLRDLFGIVGASANRSLAPRIYNAGYRALGLPSLCLPFWVEDFERFWRTLVHAGLPGLGVPLRGLTVTSPNKEAALALAALSTVRARESGAANSLVRAGEAWQAATTTRLASSVEALRPAGRSAAVVGCGGSGRALAAELRRHGAAVTLVNRGERRACFASGHLDLPWVPLAGFSPGRFQIVVNATPLAERAPFAVGDLDPAATVVDLAYVPGGETALASAARARGHLVVDGRRLLAAETAWQFELMTGQPLPAEALAIARGGSRLI